LYSEAYWLFHHLKKLNRSRRVTVEYQTSNQTSFFVLFPAWSIHYEMALFGDEEAKHFIIPFFPSYPSSRSPIAAEEAKPF
jgi:hypothetical protein